MGAGVHAAATVSCHTRVGAEPTSGTPTSPGGTERKAPSSAALWIAGLAILLCASITVGLLLVSYFRTAGVSQDSEVVRLKNDIHRLQTQLEAVEIEYHNALLHRDRSRAATLCDQFAARADEQATACDLLAVRLTQGNERDDCVRMAQDRRRLALTWRTCAAQIRSSP